MYNSHTLIRLKLYDKVRVMYENENKRERKREKTGHEPRA